VRGVLSTQLERAALPCPTESSIAAAPFLVPPVVIVHPRSAPPRTGVEHLRTSNVQIQADPEA
jgi:hypothetical protein